ncbi:hypothetical protein AMTR_s00053p00105210 [Amborella trichopoda]|uniref:Uncharacterized protein n=1 Tax=Amborella trichopoda TaxID=13333 RepID=W1P584_AMBTC|nr:hypothetical protein AMTR_s00053p00105210 [Amborella trichopoda]
MVQLKNEFNRTARFLNAVELKPRHLVVGDPDESMQQERFRVVTHPGTSVAQSYDVLRGIEFGTTVHVIVRL